MCGLATVSNGMRSEVKIVFMQPPKGNQDSRDCVETRRNEDDPLLALRGSGKELWADEYVARLREGWE